MTPHNTKTIRCPGQGHHITSPVSKGSKRFTDLGSGPNMSNWTYPLRNRRAYRDQGKICNSLTDWHSFVSGYRFLFHYHKGGKVSVWKCSKSLRSNLLKCIINSKTLLSDRIFKLLHTFFKLKFDFTRFSKCGNVTMFITHPAPVHLWITAFLRMPHTKTWHTPALSGRCFFSWITEAIYEINAFVNGW